MYSTLAMDQSLEAYFAIDCAASIEASWSKFAKEEYLSVEAMTAESL